MEKLKISKPFRNTNLKPLFRYGTNFRDYQQYKEIYTINEVLLLDRLLMIRKKEKKKKIKLIKSSFQVQLRMTRYQLDHSLGILIKEKIITIADNKAPNQIKEWSFEEKKLLRNPGLVFKITDELSKEYYQEFFNFHFT